MNRENLLILAEYLEDLPDDYEHFDIWGYYSGWDYRQYISGASSMSCGTVACVVGHGPSAGLTLTDDEMLSIYSPSDGITWERYCWKVFELKSDSIKWSWLFDSLWVDIDNTPKGAAARIRYLLDGQDIPEKGEFWKYTTPEIYKKYLKGN